MAKNTYEYPERKSLTKQTVSGFFWQTSGTVVAALSQFLVMIVLTRLLNPSEFGLVTVAYTVTAFTDIMNQLGLSSALIQRKTLTNNHIRTAFTFTNLTGFALTALLWTAAPFLARFFNDAEGLTGILRGLSLIYITSSLGQVARALNYRNLNYRIKTMLNIVSYIIGYGFVGISMAFLGFGAWALVGAALTQSILLSGSFLFVSPHSFRPMLDRQALSDLFGYGVGLTIGEVFLRIAANADYFIVGKTMGLAQVGIYGRAFQLMSLPNKYFGRILQSVLFTATARVQDEPKTLRAIYRRGVSMIAVIVLPISAILFVFAPETIRFLFGSEWYAVVLPFQILVGSMVFRLVVRMTDIIVKTSGTIFKRAVYQFVYALLVIAGAWIGHFWGVSGVAVGVSVAALINFFSMTSLSIKITQMKWSEIGRLYLPSLYLTMILLLESLGLALLLRNLAMPTIVTLFLGLTITGISSIGLIWLAPKTFIGAEGEWFFRTIVKHLPGPFKRRFVRLSSMNG